MKYICELCGWTYDESAGYPKKGIQPGTQFAQLPEDFECPSCYCGKEAFDPVDSKPDLSKMTMQSK